MLTSETFLHHGEGRFDRGSKIRELSELRKNFERKTKTTRTFCKVGKNKVLLIVKSIFKFLFRIFISSGLFYLFSPELFNPQFECVFVVKETLGFRIYHLIWLSVEVLIIIKKSEVEFFNCSYNKVLYCSCYFTIYKLTVIKVNIIKLCHFA